MSNRLLTIIAIVVIVLVGYWFYQKTSKPPEITGLETKSCEVDSDCVVFGKDGDCNCGCFNNEYKWEKEGDCFCAAPKSCQCVVGECKEVFEENKTVTSFEECAAAGNPVLESYPRQCRTPDGTAFVEEHCAGEEAGNVLTLAVAREIAEDSQCGERLEENTFCNESTGTWWIDLDIEKEGCNPACVISVETRKAEINWRCTGLNLP